MALTDQDAIDQYVELVKYLAKSLLDSDVPVDVSAKVHAEVLRIDLDVPEAQRGRVIGRGGRVARALRHLVSVAAVDTPRKVVLNIVD